MWFIGVELEQETSAPPPKENPGSAPVSAIAGVRNCRSTCSGGSIQARGPGGPAPPPPSLFLDQT